MPWSQVNRDDWSPGGHFKMGIHACVHAQSCLTLCDPMDWGSSARLLCPWDFPGKNTRVGCHFLLQGSFLTQRSNLSLMCLLQWQVDSLPLSATWAVPGTYEPSPNMGLSVRV